MTVTEGRPGFWTAPRRRCLAVIFSMAVLGGCGEPEPLKIGFIGDLTGRFSVIGEAARNSVQLAVDEINEAGGINGRKVALLVRDNQSQPAVAVQAVRDLHDSGAVAIIGPNISTIATDMLPVLNELRMPAISPTTAALSLVGLDDYLFRINGSTRDYARGYANHFFGMGMHSVTMALDANNPVFSESWANEFSDEFVTLGGRVPVQIFFDATAPEGYSSVTEQLIGSQVDAVLLIANSVDTAQFAQQIRKRDPDIPIIASEWAASERLAFLGGKAIEGINIALSYERSSAAPAFQNFVESYRKKFQQEPSFSSISGYDAVIMLSAALETGAEDGPALKRALLELREVNGLQQQLSFDAYGDGRLRVIFYIIEDGRYVQQ